MFMGGMIDPKKALALVIISLTTMLSLLCGISGLIIALIKARKTKKPISE